MKQILLVVFVVLLVTTSTHAQCPVPKYRIGRINTTLGNGLSIGLGISIRVTDFAPLRLVCLAAVLKQRYGDYDGIYCEIFSDHKVAEQYDAVTGLHDPPVVFKRITFRHAIYSYDREQGQRLYINPDPLQDRGGSPTGTTIALPVAGTPQCNIHLSGRCLLVLPTIWPFRSEAGMERDGGSITLAGRVGLSGRVGNIRVLDDHLNPGEDIDFLRRVAIRHLKAWRFEPAARPDATRVTYQFRFRPPSPGERPWHMPVRFEQPDKSVVDMNLSILKP